MGSLPEDTALNPAQAAVLEQLRVPPEQRPRFDPSIGADLRAALEEGLSSLLGSSTSDEVTFISKHDLATIHGCEVRYLAEKEQGFQWSVPVARGTVAHKAIELMLNWRGEIVPVSLVDEALARLEHDQQPVSDFLQTCTEGDLADLRGRATESVVKFLECFPPPRRSWRPVTESRMRVELAGDRVVLSGKADLTLGQADGTTAGKVVIDLKTGGFSPSHLDDLRFYALLETIRLGVPPMKLATLYLDSCRLHPEDVTIPLLQATVSRVLEGAERLLSIARQPEGAATRPGPPCRWCPVSQRCEPGQAWLQGSRETGDLWDPEVDVN